MTAPVDLDPGHQAGDPPIADEQLFEQKEVAGLSQMQIVRRRFLRHRGAMSSMLLLAAVVVVSISSVGVGPIPGWWKWEPNQGVPPVADDGPTLSLRPGWLGGSGIGLGSHPFGVDNELGRDMFAMTMKGVQTSLTIILVYGALALIIGVTVGAIAGYFGGWLDTILMRITEVFMVIPLLVVAAVAGYAFNATGVWSLAILLGVVGWTGLSRLVRAEFLALREREFVDAARVAGASSRRIIFKHILPNSVGVIVVSMTLLMGAGILAEAALGFLGFGVQRPDISLGNLVEDYKTAFSVRPWLFLWPGVFIVAIVLSLQFIGDGLRDAFDPRQKRIPKRKDLGVDEEQIRGQMMITNMARHSGSHGA